MKKLNTLKSLTLYFLLLFVIGVTAQESEAAAVRQTIETFFDGFHKQDSLIMKATLGESPVLQSIGATKAGGVQLKSDNFESLLKSIVSIPDSINFQERIKSFNIQIDGAMANAWTPYEFWINEQFSHCGVNSFQLFKGEAGWKIIYLVDTRRKEGCVD